MNQSRRNPRGGVGRTANANRLTLLDKAANVQSSRRSISSAGLANGGAGTRSTLDDAAWFDLVERLAELAPEDLEAAVLAVRLCRRFEEEGRHLRGISAH
jgi:hypothetical protein